MPKKKNVVKNLARVGRATRRALRAAGVTQPGRRIGRALDRRLHLPGLATGAGALLDRVSGMGDYQLATGTRGAVRNELVPLVQNSRRGFVLRHREYIGDVTSSTSFSIASYRVNPADPTTFPWLSSIAASFDKYDPRGIVFTFKSTSAEWNGTTQALGTVILAPDYDPVDVAYSSKAEMEQAEGARSTRASESIHCPIECDPRQRPYRQLWTKSSPGPIANTDTRAYDLATFQIATTGFSASGVVIGELWVSYEIEFFAPQPSNYNPGLSCCLASTVSATTTDPFLGMSTRLDRVNTLKVSFPSNVEVVLHNAKPGCYYYLQVYAYNSPGFNALSGWTGAGCTIHNGTGTNLFAETTSGGWQLVTDAGTAATDTMVFSCWFKCAASGNNLTSVVFQPTGWTTVSGNPDVFLSIHEIGSNDKTSV